MISQYKIPVIFALVGMTLSGCVMMTAVPANKSLKAETAFSVTPTAAWTRMPNALNPTTGSALTQDGVPLGAVYLITVKNDKPMLDKTAGKNLPRYTSGSTALEQIDFLESSINLIGYSDVIIANIRPATIGGQSGTEFEFTGKYANGLDLQGDVALFEANDELNIVFYTAPKMHYYNKYKSDADAIFRSVSLTK